MRDASPRSASMCWLLSLATFLVVAGAPSARAQVQPVLCDSPIMTDSGAVQGVDDPSTQTCSWKGLPFAAPPVDELRWRPPADPEPWAGVRQADALAPRCMQKSVMELVNFDPAHEESEDCLYLNVWRPQTPGPHPVMVWLHGGGLFGGTANTPFYDGGRLAQAADAVVVTFNYRLAIFGYLASEALASEDEHGSAGNYGLLDQIKALEWVKQNAAAFGGDTDNVTIFGESAGGWSVCTLLVSPLAEGLFDKAIMQSGGCTAITSLERGFEVGERVAADTGCPDGDLACLRAVPPRRLMRQGVKPEIQGFEWMPRVDGWALPGRPADLIAAGRFHDVPFIAGANRDEVKVAVAFKPTHYLDSPGRYLDRLTDKFGSAAAQSVSDLYPLASYGRPAGAYRDLLTDMALLCPTFDGLMTVAEQQPQTWLYRFDYDAFRFGRLVGAAHGMEVAFVFGNLDRLPIRPMYSPWKLKRGEALAQQMMAYWGAFAHTGDPNVEGQPAWPAFPQGAEVLLLDAQPQAQGLSAQLVERCGFWSDLARAEPWLVETMGISTGTPGREKAGGFGGASAVAPSPSSRP